MAIGDLFGSKKSKDLSARVAELEAMLTPEMRDHAELQRRIEEKTAALDALDTQYESSRTEKEAQLASLSAELSSLQDRIRKSQAKLIQVDDEVLVQSFGLYTPRYSFSNSTEYKDKLFSVRSVQKAMLRAGSAATASSSWTVNGNASAGSKIVGDLKQLLLRAFNSECDDAVEHVKYNNIEASEKKIRTSAATISRLGSSMGISLSGEYVDLKIEELHLAYEFAVAKQLEKERLKELRAEERERAKLEKEIAEARKKIEKEQSHYTKAVAQLQKQYKSATPAERADLDVKIQELQAHLEELGASMEQIDYREANQKAGYVYIISNIGAFGENIYKIGMTRRLEPMDRIDELGDASVPFNFDVHALIFSDDAPALEAALHRAFEAKKLNMVNPRREFFNVTLDEIKKVVKENYDKTVEFIDVPPAEQFRESVLLRGNL